MKPAGEAKKSEKTKAEETILNINLIKEPRKKNGIKKTRAQLLVLSFPSKKKSFP